VNTGDTTAHTARSVHPGNVVLGTLVAGSFALRLPYQPCSAVCDTTFAQVDLAFERLDFVIIPGHAVSFHNFQGDGKQGRGTTYSP
jgi:hypothetical protein